MEEQEKYIVKAYQNSSPGNRKQYKKYFMEYAKYLFFYEKFDQVSQVTREYLEVGKIDSSEPIFDYLINSLELTGDIETLLVLLEPNLELDRYQNLYNYCKLLQSKEDGKKILKYFGQLNRYVRTDIYNGLKNFHASNGHLPESIEYIGKHPMDPLTFQYLQYRRFENKVNAELTLHEPERYYLKYWRFYYKGGIEFSSL